MSYEVEVKYRSVDRDQLILALDQAGAVRKDSVSHEDIYLSHPARDFAQTNEAFRIRRIGDQNRITYKGPRLSGPTKTREEIEIALAEGPEPFRRLLRLLQNLGFQPVATIRKQRETFHLSFNEHAMEIALDAAAGLGDFAEIETLAAHQGDLAAAQQAVLALADTLGLTEVEPRSYLRMILQAQGSPVQEHP